MFSKLAVFSFFILLVGCSKDDLQGTYKNEMNILGKKMSHILVFESEGAVGHSTIFSETDLNYGIYSVKGDIVTVTISGSFSDKPTDFHIESSRLIRKKDGAVWNKVQ